MSIERRETGTKNRAQFPSVTERHRKNSKQKKRISIGKRNRSYVNGNKKRK